jgi:biopolymer transport protein ExbD
VPKVQQHQSGGSGRGRRGRSSFVATSLAEINVVPLVDVMLVLLIIFMVTAPMMQQGLEVNLPQSRRSTPVTAQPVYVTVPADFNRHRVVQIDKAEVKIEYLGERLKQQFLTRADKSVFVRGDAATSFQDLMTVMDRLKEAGIEKVGLMSKPVETR